MEDLRCNAQSPSGLRCNLPIGHPLGRHVHMEWDEESAEEVESWPT